MMRRLGVLCLFVSIASFLGSCAEKEPESAANPPEPTERAGELVYVPADDPLCTDEDPQGNPYSGAPTNAAARPTWGPLDIQHPADMLDHDNDPGTADIPLRQLPDYRDVSHNLNAIQSLQFLISIVTRLTGAVENAQEYIAEGQYVDDATGWLNDQIPQTTGHCICIGSCAPGGCDPATIVSNVENMVHQILENLDFEQLLSEFLQEKIDATIADFDALLAYFQSRFTVNHLTDVLGQAIRNALTTQMQDAVSHFAATVATCQPLIDTNDPNFGPFQVDIDAAVDAAMDALEAEFAADIAAIKTVIELYNQAGAALPVLKEKVVALLAQFQGIKKLEDLFEVDWDEVTSIVNDIVAEANAIWPAVEQVMNQDWQALWNNNTSGLPQRIEQLAQSAYDDVINALLSSPNAAACINSILDSGSYLNPSLYDAQAFIDAFEAELLAAVQQEWTDAKAQIQLVLQNLQDRIAGIGEDALDLVEAKFEAIKAQIISAATAGCYMRGYRADCYDFCGTTDPSSPEECFLWLPADFLQQPAATAASATLFVLGQTGFLDKLVAWINDNIADYLDDKLGALANFLGTVGETLQKINDLFYNAFAYIDRFSEGYHLGGYSELRPDLHMCIGYAGHGAYAQMGGLGGDSFSIGARYSSHNLSKKHRVQFRSGGFAVSAFGYDLSLLPGIEVNTQIHGFKLWDIRRPLGIPLNVSLSPEALARLDIFAVLPEDNTADPVNNPFGLIIDQGNGLPLGALIVRDLWPVRDANNDVVWPRPEVSDVIDPSNTPGAPAWESDSTAVVSLGLNLPIDIDPPRTELPAIPIVPGILVIIPYFDIAFGVAWVHQTDLYLDRILEKVNENLPLADRLGPEDMRRPMHALQSDDLSADNGTSIYVEPEIGFDVFLGFKIWKIKIGAYASLGLAVNIRPGGHGGVVDLNSALSDALLHSNPPVDAPCTPIWETTLHENCNNVLSGGDAETTYSCEPGDVEASCCVHLKVLFKDCADCEKQYPGYWACIDDWTGMDQQLCKDLNAAGKTAEEVIAALPQVPKPLGPWVAEKLGQLGDLVGGSSGAIGLSIATTWNADSHCDRAKCGGEKGPDISTALLDIHAISECAQHGSCTLADGTVLHDVTETECADGAPSEPGAPADSGELYKAIDLGELVCALTTSSDASQDGRVRCWEPGGTIAPLAGNDAPSPTIGGKDLMECDSTLCAHGRESSLTASMWVAPYIYSLDVPEGCAGPMTDCSHQDGPVHDIALGPEGATSITSTGALRYDDDGKCANPFDPNFPSSPATCATNYLVQRLACEYATPAPYTGNVVPPAGTCAAEVNPKNRFVQVEYDDTTLCGIRKLGDEPLPALDVPTELRPGGDIVCAVAHSEAAPFGPTGTDSCKDAVCPFGYVCDSTAKIPPTCVLEFGGKSHLFHAPFSGWDNGTDFVDVASVGNQVVCGIHKGDVFGGALAIQCGVLEQRTLCNTNLLLNAPKGAWRDIEPGGTCTMCALSADRTTIACWGDEIGGVTYQMAAPTDDPFVDMGGLSSKYLPEKPLTEWGVCGVTQSGGILCSDPIYEPGVQDTTGNGGGSGDSGGIFLPYQCVTKIDTEVSGWEGDGCHPLQHGYTSACGCATDDDCAAGETCVEGKCHASGAEISCVCDAGGGCPSGRVCQSGACTRQCTSHADCATNSECKSGACTPKHGIPYAEVITWGMANVPAPMHTVSSYAMSDILATLILKLSVGIEASFKFIKKERKWTLFKYSDAWDLGSTWKGWYQPGLEARYQDECADPDLTSTVTNRHPRSLTTNPYDAAFEAAGVNAWRHCDNGGVCRYRDPLPASQTQPWQYTDGNVGDVEDFVTWCKDDMPNHVENPDPATPEDLMDGIVDTYNFGADVGWHIYATRQPCIDGQPLQSWLADVMPTTDANGNITDEGLLGESDCKYDDPSTGVTHSFPCDDITANMMRVWGCLDRTASPYAQALWDEFPELRASTDPNGAPHEHIVVNTMFWPTPGDPLASEYTPETMKAMYRYYVKTAGFFPIYTKVGEKWLAVVEACFDARYDAPDATKCECTSHADCDESRGEQCSAGGCLEPRTNPMTGAVEYAVKECPIVYIDLGVDECCGDGTVQAEPVQIIAPASPEADPELYAAHGCDDPQSDDPVCTGLWYVEECDEGPDGGDTCTTDCRRLDQPTASGACCLPGACFENLTAAQCKLQGGQFHSGTSCEKLGWCQQSGGCVEGAPCDDGDACTTGDRCTDGACAPTGQETCAPDGDPCTTDACDPKVGCTYPTIPGCGGIDGACCLPIGCTATSAATCNSQGGVYHAGTSCQSAGVCGEPPTGACCTPDGSCFQTDADKCKASFGAFTQGASCEQVGCGEPTTGACCLPDGTCVQTDADKCKGNGGAYSPGALCEQVKCAQPISGACCLPNGACMQTDVAGCKAASGSFLPGGSCKLAPCAEPVGACCLPSGRCVEIEAGTCLDKGGSFSPGSTCDMVECKQPTVACCLREGGCADISALECKLAGGKATVDATCGSPGVCNACKSEADCDDGDACTLDRCLFGTCAHKPSKDPLCCTADADCTSDDPCQVGTCAKTSHGKSQCRYAPKPGCCTADDQCKDRNLCTVDACDTSTNQCLPKELIPGCCTADAQCNDGNPCTKERCIKAQCVYSSPLPGCSPK